MSHSSAVDNSFEELIAFVKPRVVVEIGTYKGESAAVLAKYADKVITIDVSEDHMDSQLELWCSKGVIHKIQRVVMYSSIYKKKMLERLDFDFAFIDGSHLLENIGADFLMTQKCGRVLFHDYWPEDGGWPDVRHFVDNYLPPGEKVVRTPFVLWLGQNSL